MDNTMTLRSFFDFSAAIGTHAKVVGCIMMVDAIVSLLIGVWWPGSLELPIEEKIAENVKLSLLATGVLVLIFTIIYWVGFLKRQQCCLAVCLGFLGVCITLHFIGFLAFLLELNIKSAGIMIIVLAINGYSLLVTYQLRRSFLNVGEDIGISVHM